MLQSSPTLVLAEKCPTELPLGPSSPQPLLSLNLSSRSKLGVCLPKRVSYQHKEDCKMTLVQSVAAEEPLWWHPSRTPRSPLLCPSSAGSALNSLWWEPGRPAHRGNKGGSQGLGRHFRFIFDMLASCFPLYFALFHSLKPTVLCILILWVQCRADYGSEVSIV